MDLRSGDELVISTHGYGAVRMALGHRAARAGARVVEAAYPVGAGDNAIVAAYAAACLARTRLVVVDRITSPTTTVIPMAAAVAAVTGSGAAVAGSGTVVAGSGTVVAGPGASVLVDAAHAPGQLRDDNAGFGPRPLDRQPAQVGVPPA